MGKLNIDDGNFLKWIRDRLVFRHHENPEISYIKRLDQIIKNTKYIGLEESVMFELNEEIEVSNFEDFDRFEIGVYKYTDPDGLVWVVNEKGFMEAFEYARKIEKKVAVCINFKVYEISVEFADKIIAGECNV